jgi:hypothetical protein
MQLQARKTWERRAKKMGVQLNDKSDEDEDGK